MDGPTDQPAQPGSGSWSLRNPRLTLLIAAACVVVLGAIGLGVEGKLSPSDLTIAGTDSERAEGLVREHFGDSAPFAILLEGPRRAVDTEGPQLVSRLRDESGVTTISPWDRGSGVDGLRPSRREALILVDFHVGAEEAVRETVPKLERIVDEEVSPPVDATATGYAIISNALQERSISSTRRAELIAVPILIVVLLLVLRSPIAAAIPLMFGAATVLASRGVVSLLSGWISFDAFALAATSMMGLALGVDYALLMVSRFREELAAGEEPRAAALLTRQTAGRTTVFAGSTLFLATTVCALMLPGSLLVSLAAAVAVVTALSVLVAWLVAPALLELVGPGVNRWRLVSRRGAAPAAFARTALRHPRAVAALIALALLALAAPAAAISTGPPSIEQLPSNDPVRQDAELIAERAGPGWAAPFIVIAAAEDGSIAESRRLRTLARWQDSLAGADGIEAVIGPGALAQRTKPLQGLGEELFGSSHGSRFAELGDDLAAQLNRAADGVKLLREGVAEAGRGAALLAGGTGQAEAGAEAIAAGLGQAAAGGGRAREALDRFASGARRLARAEGQVLAATRSLGAEATDVERGAGEIGIPNAEEAARILEAEIARAEELAGPALAAEEQIAAALAALEGMTIGQGDPLYAETLEAVRAALGELSGAGGAGTEPAPAAGEGAGGEPSPAEGEEAGGEPGPAQAQTGGEQSLAGELGAMATQLRDARFRALVVRDWLLTTEPTLAAMRRDAGDLERATERLRDGARRLADGAERLAGGAEELSGGIERLTDGAERLAGGLGRLRTGARTLADELVDGHGASYPLERGLDRAGVRINTGGMPGPDLERLRRASPGIFDSGYFLLAGLDGAPTTQRERITQAIDLDRGGRAALVLAVPGHGLGTPGAADLRSRLADRAAVLGKRLGAETAVAGGAAQVDDYERVTSARIPILVAVISLLTFAALVVILRAIPLAAIAVMLNLATVAAAFGVLALLFEVPDGWPLGGRSYVDTVGAAGIFGVVFGLSIDYAVFLLVRMRESFEAHGDNDVAIGYGLERTASVITGAAAIMAAVFVAFAAAPIATVSQLGVGLTVAVLLDATIIRLVLLPAIMHLAGPRVWWIPGWLDRRLPRLTVEGAAIPGAERTQTAAVAAGQA